MDEQNAIEQPDELRVTFRKPIEFAGETYAHVDLREPTAAEWEQWDKLSGVPANVKAISIIGGMPEGAVKQIGTRDFVRAAKFIDHFF